MQMRPLEKARAPSPQPSPEMGEGTKTGARHALLEGMGESVGATPCGCPVPRRCGDVLRKPEKCPSS